MQNEELGANAIISSVIEARSRYPNILVTIHRRPRPFRVSLEPREGHKVIPSG